MAESIDCPEEMADEKNSAGSRVFIMYHHICPGDLFPQTPLTVSYP